MWHYSFKVLKSWWQNCRALFSFLKKNNCPFGFSKSFFEKFVVAVGNPSSCISCIITIVNYLCFLCKLPLNLYNIIQCSKIIPQLLNIWNMLFRLYVIFYSFLVHFLPTLSHRDQSLRVVERNWAKYSKCSLLQEKRVVRPVYSSAHATKT